MSDKKGLNQLIQEIIRDVIPKLKGVCFTNQFLDSVFRKKDRSEEPETPEKDNDKR
jgi:hypothetical protein